jgi:hypothetical protein
MLKESQKLEALERKNKNINEKREELYAQVEKIKETMGTDFESENFQIFLDNISKMSELQVPN